MPKRPPAMLSTRAKPTSLRPAPINYLAIDPGKQGGIAFLSGRGDVEAIPMPATESDVWATIRMYAGYGNCFAMIEKVGGYQGPGSEAPGSSMFNFGWGYGGLRMALIGNGIPFDTPTPQAWQKALSIPPRKKQAKKYIETKTQWKNRLKGIAQRLFPHLTVTLATADALLILEYCRRKQEGRL